MENKKLTFESLKKFIISRTFKILKEEEIANDEEFDDSSELDSKEDVGQVDTMNPEESNLDLDFSNISAKINELSKNFSEDELVDLYELIEKAKTTGRLGNNFNYNKMSEGHKIKQFNFITTVLASLYKDDSTLENEKKNIRDVLFIAMVQPDEFTSFEKGSGGNRPSLISRIVAKNAGIYNFVERTGRKTIDGENLRAIVSSAIEDAFDYSLENFNPSRGGQLPSNIIFNATSRAKSQVQSKYAKTALGQSSGGLKGSSLDEPLGDSDEDVDQTKSDRITGEEGQKSTSQKEAAKELSDVMQNFIISRLQSNIKHGGINPSFLEVAKLLFQGHILSEISDILGKPAGTVRQIKKRMEEVITFYVQNGSFQKYIKDKTGIKVNFTNNKYAFSVQGVGEEGEKENPLEYFKQTGIDIATGDPKGEWVPLETEKEEGVDSDTLGDIAFPKRIQVGEKVKISNLPVLMKINPEEYKNLSSKKEYTIQRIEPKEFFEPQGLDNFIIIDNAGKEVSIPSDKYLFKVEPEEKEEEPENIEDLGPDDQSLTESFIVNEIMKRVNIRILKELKK